MVATEFIPVTRVDPGTGMLTTVTHHLPTTTMGDFMVVSLTVSATRPALNHTFVADIHLATNHQMVITSE